MAAGYLCAGTIISPALRAAEWSAQPWADVLAEYSDNLQLISGNAKSTEDGGLNAGLRLMRADDRGYLRLTPSLQATRYIGLESLDSNVQMLEGEWSRSGERGGWRVDAGWTRDTTLTSELAVSGLVQAHKRRLQRHLAPSFTYALSSRSTVAVDAAYTAVKYADAAFTGLVDYNNASTNLSWSYQWSERATITGTVYGTRYEAALIGNRVHTAGGQLQLSSAITERWDGVFGAGMYRSNSNGGLVNLSLIRKDEIGQWSLGASRTVDPSGAGVLVRQDRWTVAREQPLSPLWHLSASGSWVVNKDLQAVAASRDRHYRSAALSVSRILTPAWRMEARYSYDRQEFAGGIDRAERNTIMLGIHYSGNG